MPDKELLIKAFRLMQNSAAMTNTYEANRPLCKYVHATSRGHEAIQIAAGLQLKPHDYASFYYRDDAMLLAIGFSPYELMLQLLAKKDDPFSGGRVYYSHPSVRRNGFPTIPHQSSATGMQAIPTTGMAHGISYLEKKGLLKTQEKPVVICSLGDGSVTEGEVSEAMQEAVLHQLPIIYLIQDNDWGISASSSEMRCMDAYEFAAGFKGLKRVRVDGTDFVRSWNVMSDAFENVRNTRQPMLIHATCALLNHHTSGVRKEWYRTDDDLKLHQSMDPIPKLTEYLLAQGYTSEELTKIRIQSEETVTLEFEKASNSPEPEPGSLTLFEFAPSPIKFESGERKPKDGKEVLMVDAALHAMDELMNEFPEMIFYGQDVGKNLGGVFREAATLAQKYGDDRVFNTAIQEAYLVGSTAGMSAVGVKPVTEIQFADYMWSGINQLVCEIAKSCYCTMGKFPVQTLLRIPCGAYGGGGPYHSGCHESSLLPIRGIKIVYPSNSADMKGLLKASFLDPNPVILFEHKGIYWSKVPGTEDAKTIEPDKNYVIPLGKARVTLSATNEQLKKGNTLTVITYGMGVYWAKNAAKKYPGSIEIIDLRTLYPLDDEMVYASVKTHGKCLVLTEEPVLNSFAESLAGRISRDCFNFLDAPVQVYGSANLPAVPLNTGLEKEMLPNVEKVSGWMDELLGW
ncbi:MAG: tungsten formylmethanofuran dehydrogenase [Bacteroidetes bacterium RIFCSPLOWO2_12_FULL_37_12]|nr:MAG: tungsten formylmethanofuran dehydrogenase [Bacteroidetes bacterium RIFCSPLOWO2_12_FULL_37_12]